MSMSSVTARRCQGEIIEWNDEKQCGFVLPRGSKMGDTVVFLSTRALLNRRRAPKVGDLVQYELSSVVDTPQSRRLRTRLRAEQVTFVGEDLPLPTQSGNGLYIFGLIFLLAEAAMTVVWRPYFWIFLFSLVLSAFSIGQYGWDKNAAKEGHWRVPEASLQLIALLGGWPGAALAQQAFRHKTQKRSFQDAFKGVVLMNVILTAAVYYYLSTQSK